MVDRDAGDGGGSSVSPQDELPTASPRSPVAADPAAEISEDGVPTDPLGHSRISTEPSPELSDSTAAPGMAAASTVRSKSSGYEETLDGQVGPPQRAVETPPLDRWELYEILGLLGKGGMGVVYRARDRRLGRMVALKFIRGDDAVLVRRLKQEARAQASIDHPHICKIPVPCQDSDGIT